MVLKSRRTHGATWMKIRVPGRPNGRTGWVRRDALGGLHKIHTALTINRRTLRATLTRKGRVIWSSRVGVGAPGTPTPAGRFWIRERLHGFGGSLRAVGVRDERLLERADRLARRRRDRHPRHEPARADPRPAVPWLRARAELEDRPARAAHADRDAGTDSLTVSSSPSSRRLRRTFLSNLPTLVFGTSSMKANSSGIHHFATREARCSWSSAARGLAARPRARRRRAGARSSARRAWRSPPPRRSASWPISSFSRSTEEIHSPPDLMTSFERSEIRM